MMTVAFLGATSHIAKDLVRLMAPSGLYSFSLFSRRPEELRQWWDRELISGDVASLPYDQFGDGNFDAIINCVGSGDPARTAAMGGSILDLTYEFDSLALTYVREHPRCRYLFLSSGAAYGSFFTRRQSSRRMPNSVSTRCRRVTFTRSPRYMRNAGIVPFRKRPSPTSGYSAIAVPGTI
jgi:hypothetical protein